MSRIIGPVGDVIEVGEFYTVPTVRGEYYEFRDDWPVIGPKHSDVEIIGFSHEHYHVDGRFLPDDIFDILGWRNIFASPLMGRPWLDLGPVIWRRYQCRRQMESELYPRCEVKDLWLPVLEDAYANHRLTEALICPHRGAPLRGLPVDEAGCVVCPLHGLKWNLETRRLVRDD